jgi:hypothetical protein
LAKRSAAPNESDRGAPFEVGDFETQESWKDKRRGNNHARTVKGRPNSASGVAQKEDQ